MAKSRHYHRKRLKKTGQFKVYFLIALGSFIVAAAISFITGQVPAFVENVLNRQIESAISQKVDQFSPGGDTAGQDSEVRKEMERLKKEFKKMRR